MRGILESAWEQPKSRVFLALGTGVAGVALAVWVLRRRRRQRITVTELVSYPVKSCGGISWGVVGAGGVCFDACGLLFDRRWMVVDRDTGKFVCQRQFPLLAAVKAAFQGEAKSCLQGGAGAVIQLRVGPAADPGARASAAGTEPLVLAPRRLETAENIMDVMCIKARCEAEDVGDAARKWWESLLQNAESGKAWAGQEAGEKRNFALVEQTPASRPRRVLDDERMKTQCRGRALPSDLTAFGDHASFLLIGSASLAELNRRLSTAGEQVVGMDRFRPNIVAETGRAHEEDAWRRIRIGGHDFEVLKLCTRCELPTVEQERGVVDPGYQPMKMLKSYRASGTCGVNFGVHLRYSGRVAGHSLPDSLHPSLIIGAVVEVLESSSPDANIPQHA